MNNIFTIHSWEQALLNSGTYFWVSTNRLKIIITDLDRQGTNICTFLNTKQSTLQPIYSSVAKLKSIGLLQSR